MTLPWHFRTLILTSTLLVIACSEQRAQQGIMVDSSALSEPRATLDPTGILDLRGGTSAWRVRFAPFELPLPGAYKIGPALDARTLQVALLEGVATASRPVERPLREGKLELARCTEQGIQGMLEYANEQTKAITRVKFDVVPVLAPARPAVVVDAKPVPTFAPPKDQPDPEDLVFCAFGCQGTGMPGQRAVAESIGKLAATGPLDFVILLGDAFLPRGVDSIGDPQWRSKFETMYDAKRLPMNFYAVAGPAEWAGRYDMVEGYGKSKPRFLLKQAPGANFTMQSHGKTIEFFPMDTHKMTTDLKDVLSRTNLRSVTQELASSKADWKIAFGHTPIRAAGAAAGSARNEALSTRFGHRLGEFKVDVYIAADERVLQLFRPINGTTHVTSGGGGGPEYADSTKWTEDTVFAATGGGFTWFRFDGKVLEISFRDSYGKVLYVHQLKKE